MLIQAICSHGPKQSVNMETPATWINDCYQFGREVKKERKGEHQLYFHHIKEINHRSILDNGSHPLYSVLVTHRSTFSSRLLPPRCTTERHRKLFIPVAIKLYNSSASCREMDSRGMECRGGSSLHFCSTLFKSPSFSLDYCLSVDYNHYSLIYGTLCHIMCNIMDIIIKLLNEPYIRLKVDVN